MEARTKRAGTFPMYDVHQSSSADQLDDDRLCIPAVAVLLSRVSFNVLKNQVVNTW